MIDRYGNHVVMVPILFTMILGFVAIALAHSNLVLLLGAVLVGIGYGSIPSAGQTIAVQKVKLNKFSLATSTLYIYSIGFRKWHRAIYFRYGCAYIWL